MPWICLIHLNQTLKHESHEYKMLLLPGIEMVKLKCSEQRSVYSLSNTTELISK